MFSLHEISIYFTLDGVRLLIMCHLECQVLETKVDQLMGGYLLTAQTSFPINAYHQSFLQAGESDRGGCCRMAAFRERAFLKIELIF